MTLFLRSISLSVPLQAVNEPFAFRFIPHAVRHPARAWKVPRQPLKRP